MLILIAAHGYPPTHSAGAERRAERMAKWLHANGHTVEVFAVEQLDSPGFRMETTTQDSYRVHRLYYDLSEGDDPFRNVYDNPRIGAALRDVLANQSFDLVHLISGYLLAGQVIHTAHEFHLPVVITLTEYWFMCTRLNLIQPTGAACSGPESDEKCARCLLEDKRRYRFPAQIAPSLATLFWNVAQKLPFASEMTGAVAQRRVTLRDALDAADLVICPSQFLINQFSAYGFDSSRFVFMRQGLNPPPDDRPMTPAVNGPLRLGYVGQIQHHKGIDLVVDAAIKLRDAGHNISLDIWGSEKQSPDYTAKLKAHSAAYPDIHWNGPYAGSKVWEALGAMDALVVPSRWVENSPNVILEAYAIQLPVVATNLGGMAELVPHEQSGLLFTLNDADDLAEQIRRLIEEPGLIERLRANIPPVKTIEEEMQAVMAQYNRMLGQTSP